MHSDTLVGYRGKSEKIVRVVDKSLCICANTGNKDKETTATYFSKAEREEVIV